MSDTHAEAEVLLSHAAHVRRLARRLVFDAELAREVEQETWLAALQHAPRDLRNPRAWLSRITRRVACRLWSRQEPALEEAEERVSPADPPPDLLEREHALLRLLAAVRRLPEPLRTTVTLHHLDGLTLREVAVRTRAPLETVRSRNKRGLSLLRDELARGRGGGSHWCLALVKALDLAPLRPEKGLALCLRDLCLPVILMSTTAKLAASTGGVALLLVSGWYLLDPAESTASREPVAPPRPATSENRMATQVADAVRSTERVPANADRVPAVQPAPESAPVAAGAMQGVLRVEVVWAEDGSPAAEVPLYLRQNDVPADRQGLWLESSSEGVLVIQVLPGAYGVECPFGGFARGVIEAGKTSEIVLEIPVGIGVDGRVVTDDGTPVEGAAIFLWPGGLRPQFDGVVVARSDVHGEFALRSVGSGVGACLSARAPGHAPTQQYMLTGAPGADVEPVLVLPGEGRSIVGRVLSPRGAPIADAEVLVGPEREVGFQRRPDGTLAYPPIGQVVRSGLDGRFEVPGAPLETLDVQVRAPGYAPWRGFHPADDEGWLQVRLEPAAHVQGVARGSDGEPLAGVRVTSGAEVLFVSTSVLTARDGSFRLGPLAAGDCKLRARGPKREEVREAFTLAAGEEREWNPSFGQQPLVRGWIEATGMDLGGWSVRGFRVPGVAGELYLEEVRTDAEGRFTLRRAPKGEITLALHAPGGAIPVAHEQGVAVGTTDVVLRADPALLPTARIVGRLVTHAGTPVRSADVWVRSPALGQTMVHPDREDGSFTLGPLPPGEWTVEVDGLTAGWGMVRETVVLGAGQTRELGDVVLGEGGTVQVSLASGSEDRPGLIVQIRDAEGRAAGQLAFTDGAARSLPLSPGEYRLVVRGLDPEPTEVPFVVTAGQETRLELP